MKNSSREQPTPAQREMSRAQFILATSLGIFATGNCIIAVTAANTPTVFPTNLAEGVLLVSGVLSSTIGAGLAFGSLDAARNSGSLEEQQIEDPAVEQ